MALSSGVLRTTLAVGATGAGLIAAGKGALIGAAVGSIIPGAGTIVGAVVGGIIGGLGSALVGGLVGRFAAGGGSRDRAEKAIGALRDGNHITFEEAKGLKDLGRSELKALGSIPKSAGDDADRLNVAKAVMLVAAKQGRPAARLLKAELLNAPPPAKGEELEESRAGIAAQNRIALQPHLTSSTDNRFAAVQNHPTRLDEYQRCMQDAVATSSRSGQQLGQPELRALSSQALDHVARFGSDNDLDRFRARRQDFDDRIVDLMTAVGRDAPPAQLLHQLRAVDRAYGDMATAENLGMHGADEMEPRYAQAFGRAATRVGAQGQAARAVLEKALAADSSLRAIVRASSDAFEQAGTASESEAAMQLRGAATRVVKLLGNIAGPVGNSVETDELALDETNSVSTAKQTQANQAVDREISRSYIDGATLNHVFDRTNHDWLAGKFEEWARTANFSGENFNVINAVSDTLAKSGNDFQNEFDALADKMFNDEELNIGENDKNNLRQVMENNPSEQDLKNALSDIRSHFRNMYDLDSLNGFKDWLKGQEGLD